MIRIFENINPSGEGLTVEVFDGEDGVWVTTHYRDGWDKLAIPLDLKQVTELRAALRNYEEVPGSERAEAFQEGYEAAKKGLEETLDPARVDALFLAANVAKDLRSGGPLGAGAASHETVLAYALFLLDELPMPAVAP